MGFLQIAPGSPLNMNKVVLSIWFGIPAATASLVAARDSELSFDGFRVLRGVIPLFMFGEQQTGTKDGSYPMQPSCIGIRVGDGIYDVFGKGYLDVHIQTEDTATSDDGGGSPIPNYSCTDYFGNSDMASPGDGGGYPEVDIDVWQHVALSWDLGSSLSSGEDTVSSSSVLYCAVNRVNKSGDDLPALWPESFGVTAGNNIMVSNTVALPLGLPGATASLGVSSIPYSPIWIPGPATILNASGSIVATQNIRLADFQLFTDVSTDVAANISAFVTEDGRPASPALAASLLGKSPEILLQTSSDWITGNNRGTLGNFTKTGTITAYADGPSA